MRKYLMEMVGTFFLAMAIVFTSNPIPIGLMLMAMLYIGGHVSGGHYNPAVSVAMWLDKRLSQDDLLKYLGAQIVGACIALFFFNMATGNMYKLDVSAEVPMWIGFAMEALLTCVLAWVVLCVTSVRELKATAVYGFAIGLTLAGIAFFAGLYNPAIAIASMIMDMTQGGMVGAVDAAVIYLLGPIAGGCLAWWLHCCCSGATARS